MRLIRCFSFGKVSNSRACYKKKHTLIFSYLYAPAFLCYTQFKKFTVKGVYTK